jgi:TetR/AcrR family transcriptional repressor of mexJK operon
MRRHRSSVNVAACGQHDADDSKRGGEGGMIDAEALSPEKRAQILHGAGLVFAQDGYEGASMSRIARAANVSKGTLYNHFAGKAELFSAHLAQAYRESLSHIFERLGDEEGLEQALGAIGRRLVDMVLTPERRGIYRMVISEAESFPELARAFYEAGPCVGVGVMATWIAARVQRGQLVADDTEFAAEQFFALCQTRLWMRYRLHIQEQPSEAEIQQVVTGAVETFLARYRAAA